MYQSIMLTSIMLIMLMSMSFLLSKKSVMDINKSSPFECGFMNFSSTRISFSIHFFMIAILFLMFDVEIAILLPIFITMKLMSIFKWMKLSFIVSSIITYGLYHEWMNGVIEWSK